LALADKSLFRNCLVTMRPKTTIKDLPSTHNVSVYIHNSFVEQLKLFKKEISVSTMRSCTVTCTHRFLQEAPGKVSMTSDGWTADNTKGSYLGLTAHWIEVKEGAWKLRSEVVGFQPISGDHSGGNLGRYFVALCDRVGIMSGNESKVRIGLAAAIRSLISQ
jgi:hypothetical protein